MNDPVHQHYIPKSYLKNFAEQDGKLFFVDTLMRGDKQETKSLPTRDICAEKNIYTFTEEKAGDAYALEKFYAKEVDGIYPKIYKLLTDPDIHNLHPETKKEMLNTVLSLYFRRPFFLKEKIRGLENLLARIRNRDLKGTNGVISYRYGGQSHSFKDEDLEKELETRKKAFKEEWLVEHFAEWQEFVKYKLTCGIEVITVPETSPLITSDNPVCILDRHGKLNNDDSFHADNIIEIPLNRRSYLIIHPNATSEAKYSFLHRSVRDEHFANGVNFKVQENSDQRIIGYPGDIELHFKNHERLDEFTAENVGALGKTIDKTRIGFELLEVIKNNGGTIFNLPVANKVKEIRKTGLMAGEPLLENLILELAKKGFMTV